MFTQILLASDGSDHALKAARAAAEIALKFGARLTLLSVYSPPASFASIVSERDSSLNAEQLSRYGDEVQEAVERRTGHVLDELGVQYQCRRETGHPVDVIVSVAARERYDLVVMGSRGLSAMESFLLGSVSDRVLHHAHCPVLIVK
jgi:nucleotide-binding universal stress UspA family protein